MEKNKIIKQIDIIRIKDAKKILIKDSIIDEQVLKIYINNKKKIKMVFSNTDAKELVAGFLFTQGIVQDKKDILSIEFKKQKKQCFIQLNNKAIKRFNKFIKGKKIKGSSGGILLQEKNLSPLKSNRTKPDDFLPIDYSKILFLIKAHHDSSSLFHKTGALHSAGICNKSKILFYYQDIGRHNALDKMAGDILLKNIDTSNKIATLSCRMSLEIIGKIIKMGIPIVISNAAPTLKAVKLAHKKGLTMIGFARNNRFNIYTHEQKIAF